MGTWLCLLVHFLPLRKNLNTYFLVPAEYKNIEEKVEESLDQSCLPLRKKYSQNARRIIWSKLPVINEEEKIQEKVKETLDKNDRGITHDGI